MNSGTNKTEKGIKGTWIGKLFVKPKTQKSQNEDGYINLPETTGLTMVETDKNLHDHADNIKARGKALKKKTKTLSTNYSL